MLLPSQGIRSARRISHLVAKYSYRECGIEDICAQTRSIPDQNLNPIRSLGSEHEGRAAERVETKHLLHFRSKSIVATAEVDRPRRDVNLQFGAGYDHRDARIARIT